MKENQITLISEDGKEELADILFTHEQDNNTYVVFELVQSGEVSAARYVETKDGTGNILDIETDDEWEMLDELLSSFYDEIETTNSKEDLFNKK